MRTIILSCLLFPVLLWGQSPEREFRGAWIATIKNIDWPPQPGLPSHLQQLALTDILDELQDHGFNAVILQIRPASDALYDSPYEPWSEWLTGRQGQAPRPYYDPLEFAVAEAHKRGMELHAWINPFRAVVDDDTLKWLASNHVARQHPEWTLRYGNNRYLDPGIPAARFYVQRIVLDVVRRYNIDAIHFDDYFYPYTIPGQEFPDTLSYRQFGGRFTDKDAWRRHNVDEFIRQLHDSLLRVQPDMKFGISPFGVWRNQADDPKGSATRAGITSYDGLHADTRKWLKQGWIDYVAPQLYFSIGFPPADFAVLLDWWSRNHYGKHLYIGQSAYKINNNADPNWSDPREYNRQIEQVRRRSDAQGTIMFSSNWLRKNTLGYADSLKKAYTPRVLPPVMPWLDDEPPLPVAELELDAGKGGFSLIWLDPSNPDAAYYCVYKAQGKEPPALTPENRIAIVRDGPSYLIDPELKFLRKYHYVVTTVDRHHNESDAVPVQGRWWRFWGPKATEG